MMTWTNHKIEQELLSQEIDAVAFPAFAVVDAVNRARSLLGVEWIWALRVIELSPTLTSQKKTSLLVFGNYVSRPASLIGLAWSMRFS